MVPQLQSVLVFVRDLDRAIFFYCGTLGLPLQSRWSGGAEVGAGATALTLAIVEDDTAITLTGRPTGMTFAVDRSTYERLASRGIFSGEPTQYPWGRLAIVADPDANEFALIAPVEEEDDDLVTPRLITRISRLARHSSSAAPAMTVQ